MAPAEDVELFLKQIREKMDFNPVGVVYRPRTKNTDTLSLIEMIPGARNDVIKKLTAANYYDGPKTDTHNPKMPDYYEFGVMIKRYEIYIKLNMGLPNKPIDCMSFHVAEFAINYPLKTQNK